MPTAAISLASPIQQLSATKEGTKFPKDPVGRTDDCGGRILCQSSRHTPSSADKWAPLLQMRGRQQFDIHCGLPRDQWARRVAEAAYGIVGVTAVLSPFQFGDARHSGSARRTAIPHNHPRRPQHARIRPSGPVHDRWAIIAYLRVLQRYGHPCSTNPDCTPPPPDGRDHEYDPCDGNRSNQSPQEPTAPPGLPDPVAPLGPQAGAGIVRPWSSSLPPLASSCSWERQRPPVLPFLPLRLCLCLRYRLRRVILEPHPSRQRRWMVRRIAAHL